MDILNVENLNVVLDNEVILKDVSFKVKRGEALVILGPNGAGKTTLLKALAGVIPYSGKIEWATQKVSYLPPQEFLQRRYLPPITVKEFFMLKEASEEETIKMLKMVGLGKKVLNKNFTHLSTGQFQRMLVGWALIKEPEVLLFDEPTSGIDIGGEETIYSLIHKFWKRGLTVILVTHDLSIVWEHADYVLCLNKKVQSFGKPKKVLTPSGLRKLYGTGIKFYGHGK